MTPVEAPERPAVSKLGQVAAVRNEGGDWLVRMLNIPIPTTDPTPVGTGGTMPTTDTPAAAQHPPLDQPLTTADIKEHYGLSASVVHTACARGTIRKRGTDGARHYRYDHRDLIAAFEAHVIGLPRGGGRNNRTPEQVAEWRDRIAAATTTLRAERAAAAEHMIDAGPYRGVDMRLPWHERPVWTRSEVADFLNVTEATVGPLPTKGKIEPPLAGAGKLHREALYHADSVRSYGELRTPRARPVKRTEPVEASPPPAAEAPPMAAPAPAQAAPPPTYDYAPIHPLVTFAEAVAEEAAERTDDPVWRVFGRMAERALQAGTP